VSVFKSAMRWLLGILFVTVGVLHFVLTDFFVRIMPPYLPWHRELVLVSGVFEIALGVLLLVPRWSVVAAWALIALLIAVFPANVEMSLHPERFPLFPVWAIHARLPFQAVLIAWAYWFTAGTALARYPRTPGDGTSPG
jgi:uncharacterized membrane protein